jgi:hypothetical protein
MTNVFRSGRASSLVDFQSQADQVWSFSAEARRIVFPATALGEAQRRRAISPMIHNRPSLSKR